MSNHGSGPAFASAGRFDFIVSAGADNVSVSRPVGPEDVEKLRRQLADWKTRRPAEPT